MRALIVGQAFPPDFLQVVISAVGVRRSLTYIFNIQKVSFQMLTKLFGGLAIAAGLVAAAIAGSSSTSNAPVCTQGTCCSEDCCKDCPDCSCECDCCKDCADGCECPNKS